jgi:hypothetical protein
MAPAAGRHSLTTTAPPCPPWRACENSRLSCITDRGSPHMDIERINAIGSLLTDLSERTQALRGYL